MPEGASELLKISLSAAVPLWIAELRGLPWSEISRMAGEASQYIAEHGDALMYKTKGVTSKAFNHLARGLAALSFAPGGVKFLGMHFESRHEGGETAVAAGRPRNLTFEKGTIGRIVLKRGIRMESVPAESNPLLGDDPWQGMANHFRVRLTGHEGRELLTHFSVGIGRAGGPDLERVLLAIGGDALDAERAQGSVQRYADLLGFDPKDPEVEKELRSMEAQASKLREFLGDDDYREFLEIAETER